MYQPTPIDDYVVTPMPDGTYSVWNESKDTRYDVWQAGNSKWWCDCPHWSYRCKKWGVDCNHITAVKRYKKREETNDDNYFRRTDFVSPSIATA